MVIGLKVKYSDTYVNTMGTEINQDEREIIDTCVVNNEYCFVTKKYDKSISVMKAEDCIIIN